MAKMTLDDLVSQLTAAYGTGLRAVALYGSAARGERLTRNADLNVLVVVEAITMDHLRRESAIATAWADAGNPPPLTLTVDEWRGSVDIFPMEYADILAHHKLLSGTLPLDGLSVSRKDLRLQLEHEAMSKLLRLRHSILTAGGSTKRHREIMELSVRSMLALLRAAARVTGMEPPAESQQLLAELGARLRMDLGPFQRVLRLALGDEKVPDVDIRPLLEDYLGAVERLARFADTLDGA